MRLISCFRFGFKPQISRDKEKFFRNKGSGILKEISLDQRCRRTIKSIHNCKIQTE